MIMATGESSSSASATGRKSPLMFREDLSSTYNSFFKESTVMAE